MFRDIQNGIDSMVEWLGTAFPLALVASVLALLILTGCNDDPREGGPCTPGSAATVVKNGKSIGLTCDTDGVWRKS